MFAVWFFVTAAEPTFCRDKVWGSESIGEKQKQKWVEGQTFVIGAACLASSFLRWGLPLHLPANLPTPDHGEQITRNSYMLSWLKSSKAATGVICALWPKGKAILLWRGGG